MNLILNTNELGYTPFLDSPVDTFIIGLRNFCVNQKFSIKINEITKTLKTFKEKEKRMYLSLNLFAKEKDIKKLSKIVPKLASLEIDGYIVSDLGILNLFKKYNLENKIILDLHTYVTNKYSANSLLELGVNKVTLSREITLEDIKDIASFNDANINVLVQGFVPITYSKRAILSCYYSKYKLKRTPSTHYIKEENRDNYYYLEESKNDLIVFNDKQYSLFPYLLELIDRNINSFQIDGNFLSKEQIEEYINLYNTGISLINSKKIKEYEKLKEQFTQTHSFSNPFLYNESFLLKEGK